MHINNGYSIASSIADAPGERLSVKYRPPDKIPSGSGPIFIHSLQCNDDSPNPYLSCLNEIRLGLFESTHQDDIGLRCQGNYHL